MGKMSEKVKDAILNEIDLQKHRMVMLCDSEDKEAIKEMFEKIRENCEKVVVNSLKDLE